MDGPVPCCDAVDLLGCRDEWVREGERVGGRRELEAVVVGCGWAGGAGVDGDKARVENQRRRRSGDDSGWLGGDGKGDLERRIATNQKKIDPRIQCSDTILSHPASRNRQKLPIGDLLVRI